MSMAGTEDPPTRQQNLLTGDPGETYEIRNKLESVTIECIADANGILRDEVGMTYTETLYEIVDT